MYRITIAVVDNPVIIDTENRRLARAVKELSILYPNQLEVWVSSIAEPKPVNFKNL